MLALTAVGLCSLTATRAVEPSSVVTEPLRALVAETKSPSQERRWHVSVSQPYLSYRQRLQSDVVVVVPASETSAAKLAPHFELSILVRDKETHTPLANHSIVAYTTRSLPRRGEVRITDQTDLMMTASVLLLPGEYLFEIRLQDRANAWTDTLNRFLSVRPLKKDVLRDASANLPNVEFVLRDQRSPYEYLAGDKFRLFLPLKTRRTIHIDLVVNCCVPASVLSTLDVLSQIQIQNGAFSVRVLDLFQAKIIFEQNGFTRINASSLLASLEAAQPAAYVYDMPPSDQHHPELFRDVLNVLLQSSAIQNYEREAAGRSENDRIWIVVVLSRPTPVQQEAVASPIRCAERCPDRVFYLRHISEPDLDFERQIQHQSVFTDPVSSGPIFYDPVNSLGLPRGHFVDTFDEARDGLPKIMRLMNLRILRVNSPTDLRKAVQRILDEVERLGN